MTIKAFIPFKASKKAKKQKRVKKVKKSEKIEKYRKIDVSEFNEIILKELLTFISPHIIDESVRACLFRLFGSKDFLQALTDENVQTFRFKTKSLNSIINSFIQVLELFTRYEIGYLEYAHIEENAPSEEDAHGEQDASDEGDACDEGGARGGEDAHGEQDACDEGGARGGEDAHGAPDGYICVPYIQKNHCVISTTGSIVYTIKSNPETNPEAIKFCDPFTLKVDPNNCVTFY